MKELILAYQGEMTLKGLNRGKFEARLAKTIRWRLEPLGKFKVYQAQSTVFIEPKEDGLDMDEAFRRVSHVFGIVKLSRAVECPKDFAAICETAEAYLGETLRGIRTCKVEAKRADKTCPCASNGEILTRAAPADDVHRRQLRATQLSDVAYMDHAGKAQLCHLNGKCFDLRRPYRRDAVADRSQRESADTVEQAAHGDLC